MNEQRIRELAEQASTHAEETVHYYMGQFDGLTWEAKILKARDLKFAELIVEECLYIVEGEDDGSADTKSVRLAMIRMKQHFGVGE
jgi:hypothetical protein